MNNKSNNDKSGKILHGNSARVDPKKKVTPLWNNVVSDYGDIRYGRQLRGVTGLDDNAELAKLEVDMNEL